MAANVARAVVGMADDLAPGVELNHDAFRPSCPLVACGTPGGLGLIPARGGERPPGEFRRTGTAPGIRNPSPEELSELPFKTTDRCLPTKGHLSEPESGHGRIGHGHGHGHGLFRTVAVAV